MSILIKGMEMPQGNSIIHVLIYADGTVYTGHVNDSRYSAVSVPTPCGRLVDADALKLVLRKTMDACVDEDGTLLYSDHLIIDADYDEVCNMIDKQPTIIEAEGSKE